VPAFRLQFDVSCVRPLAAGFGTSRGDAAASAAGARARARGYYTRGDALIVYRWKSRRSAVRFEVVAASTVRSVTARAFAATDEAIRIETITTLPGVGLPVAAALLHFAFPARYPLLDVRALDSLGVKRRSAYPPSFWVEYVEFCRRLAGELGVSLRTLDKALWQASKAQGRCPGASSIIRPSPPPTSPRPAHRGP
jgi:hypothetical protein